MEQKNFKPFTYNSKDQNLFSELQGEPILGQNLQNSTELNQQDLPLIDLNDKHEIQVEKLMKAMTEVGFICLENVPGYDEVELFAACKWLFSLPKEELEKVKLQKYNSKNKNIYRGFTPLIDNDPSYKEFIDYGSDFKGINQDEKPILYEQMVWPGQDENFRNFLLKQHKLLEETGIHLMRLLAEGLKLPSNYFDSWFKQESENDEPSLSTYRMIHYPPRVGDLAQQKGAKSKEGLVLTTPEHTDSTVLTLLSTFNYYGLQVLKDDQWITVKPRKNTLIVNLGDTLSRIVSYKVKATKHRVVDIGMDRYSSPFFLEPKFSQNIPSNLFDQSVDIKQQNYGEWLQNRMKEYVEWQGVDFTRKKKN